MKKIIVIWVLAVLFLIGLNGCCKQIWPKKVVFTPELDLAIKDHISQHGLESPFVLLIGNDGRLFAMGVDGETFTPCRAPRPEEIQIDDANQVKKNREQTVKNKKKSETPADLPICEGMKEIKGIFPVENITIMTVKKNPRYKMVTTPDGTLERRCTPYPWESPNVCD